MINARRITWRLAALVLMAALLTGGMSVAGAERNAATMRVLSGMQSIRAVKQTDRLIVQAENGLWGACDTRGHQVLPCDYEPLAYLGYDFFSSALDQDPLANALALISPDGTRLSGYRYGIIRVYNNHWAVGWEVSPATKDAYDYKKDKSHYYFINSCDVYYLDGTPHLAGSFSDGGFSQGAAHGEYLSVLSRDGQVTVYDRGFQPTGFTPAKISQGVYGVDSFTLKNRVTQETILEGIASAKEIQVGDRLLLQVSRTLYNGSSENGLCDLTGAWVLPLGDYTVERVSGDWAVLAQQGKQGLYSLSKQRLVLPCEFDQIVSSTQTVDPFLFYDCYLCAEKDGARYALNTETDELIRAYDIDTKNMKWFGGSAYFKDQGKRVILGPDGRRSSLNGFRYQAARGDGRLILVQGEDGRYGVLTYTGQLLVEAWYTVPPVITDDGAIILTTPRGCDLLNVYW